MSQSHEFLAIPDDAARTTSQTPLNSPEESCCDVITSMVELAVSGRQEQESIELGFKSKRTIALIPKDALVLLIGDGG